MIKKCAECGEEFEAKNPHYRFCSKDHYRVCVVCGKQFYVPRNKLSSTLKTCSEECRVASMQSTRKSMLPEKETHYLTCQNCGKVFQATDQQWTSKTKTCSNKCRYELAQKTFQKHKEDDPEWFADVLTRCESTCLEHYGVRNPMQSKEIQAKSKETCKCIYGKESFTQTPEFKQRTIETNRERYGVDWHAQLESHQEQVRKTCLERYGVDNVGKVSKFMIDKVSDPSRLDNLFVFRNDPISYIQSHYESSPTLMILSEDLGIKESSVGWIIDQANASDFVKYRNYSRMEEDVHDFLRTIIDDSKIIKHDRQIIKPKELDLYIPEYHLGIECNPTWTHNSSLSPYGEDDGKPTTYHKEKTDAAEQAGILCFHIFGYEWEYRSAIIKSMLRNLLNANEEKIYARKTEIREVSSSESVSFLDENHRQGPVNCSVRVGLFYNDKLVSLMTFSKPRSTLGQIKSHDSNTWELVRFCNKLNTSVVGAAGKLLQYFIKTYDPKKIISYSDRAHTRGKLYETLGFNKAHVNDPGYMWVNLKTDQAYSRLNAQKRNIKQFLHDDTIDLSKTEVQIMIEHNYVQVYDSGTILWEMNR